MNLTFKNLRDEQPLPNQTIVFIVLHRPGINFDGTASDDGELHTGKIQYDLIGIEDDGASSIMYDYDDEELNAIPFGGTYQSELEEGEDPSDYVSYRKCMVLSEPEGLFANSVYPFTSEPFKDDIELMWLYEWEYMMQLFALSNNTNHKYIPFDDIHILLSKGLASLDHTEYKLYVEDEYKEWFVNLTVLINGIKFKLKCTHDYEHGKRYEEGEFIPVHVFGVGVIHD